jgi:hypothetical protein
MSTKAEIREWLFNWVNVVHGSDCVPGTGLKEIHAKVFHPKSPVNKARAAEDLAGFYAEPRNIVDIWAGSEARFPAIPPLSEVEKDFISTYIRHDCDEFKPATKALAERHGWKLPEENRDPWPYRAYWHSRDDIPRYLLFLYLIKRENHNTNAVLFFPGGKTIASFVLSVIKPLICPMVFGYEKFIPPDGDRVICRKDRIGDFAAVVCFAGNEHLKVKANTTDITPSKLAKMSESIGFEELADLNGQFSAPSEVRRGNDLKVATPLFVLSANCGLIEINNDNTVKPGGNAVELLLLPPHELAKHVFDWYCAVNNRIYETHYLTYLTLYDGEDSISWHRCRKPVIDLLKNCPVGEFVGFPEFSEIAKIFCGNFFRKLVHCAIYVKGYSSSGHHRDSYTPEWDECEERIIAQILSFLGAMGMADIAYTENLPASRKSSEDFRVGISGFRITDLGAWILGISDKYSGAKTMAAQSAEGGLLVQPDHEVIATGLKSCLENGTYLSTFLTKVANDSNVSVYKIDFPSMVRAHDLNIEPKDIKEYLKNVSEKPLPGNVIRSFDDWQAKIGRIKIRTVTILETDDRLLLEEVTHLSGLDKLVVEQLDNAVVIQPEESKKIKTIVEKNGWLVDNFVVLPEKKKKTTKK